MSASPSAMRQNFTDEPQARRLPTGSRASNASVCLSRWLREVATVDAAGAGRARIGVPPRLRRSAGEPQLQPLGAAPDDAAPQQSLRRRRDDARRSARLRDDARH